MKIHSFEQSGRIIETEGGFRLAVDIGKYTPLEKISAGMVDAMIVSHIHADHFSPEHIQKIAPKTLYINAECLEALGETELSSEIVVMKAGDTLNIGGISAAVFEVDHGPNVSVKPKENFGFLFEADGKKIYFAGDMFYPSGMDVSALEADYALLPIGGFYTFAPKEALAFAKQFKKIGTLMPMHYEIKNPEALEDFLPLAQAAGFAV